MGTLTAALILPSKLKPASLTDNQKTSFYLNRARKTKKHHHSIVPVARLFGPAIFEASKLKVLFLGVDEKKHPGKLPRTYTLTHSDVTSKLTLAISQTINNSQLQGWYNRLQRDEVVAQWKKIKGIMSLHVHCHISGGHFLLDLIARLRFYIFSKELPVVLMAFVHGDEDLLNNYPELLDALVWVYFHSNIPEFNKVECWGPLKEASVSSPSSSSSSSRLVDDADNNNNNEYHQHVPAVEVTNCRNNVVKMESPQPCPEACSCCFPPIPCTQNLPSS